MHISQWRTGSEWLMVELFRFWNNKETIACEVQLESFSRYYCGNGGIFVEGLEFNAIPSLRHKENNKVNDEKNVLGLLKPESDMEWVEQIANDHQEIIRRSENSLRNTSKEELQFLLYKGILIDKGEKIFSISKLNRKKCHMLPAKAVIYDPPNVMSFNIKPQAQSRCRFAECLEILPRHELRIKCEIETQMLSSDTTYACFLVFKLSEKFSRLECPVKARDLLPYRTERTKIISFTSPSTVNLDKIKWIPIQREDGWMEVTVWEIMSESHIYKTIPMDLKLISLEGTLSGLIICGLEFRPI